MELVVVEVGISDTKISPYGAPIIDCFAELDESCAYMDSSDLWPNEVILLSGFEKESLTFFLLVSFFP